MKYILPTLLGACLASAAVLPSQVVISEINFEPQSASDDQWIELVNLTPNKVDLTAWSVYQATNTPAAAQNYWFGFPPGTSIQPASFMRVHWLAPIKKNTATDIYTGDTVFHFLFGLKAEILGKASGALALFSTQQNLQMNDPKVIRDWVTWGVSGLKRENLAVQAKKWITGQKVASPVVKDSIALIFPLATEPTPARAFFHDASPTPLKGNHANASAASFGNACSSSVSVNVPILSALSIPAAGNRDFGFRVQQTVPGHQLALAFSALKGNGSLKIGTCPIWLGLTSPIIVITVPTKLGKTEVLAPLLSTALNGGTAHLQAIVFASPTAFGFSNGLTVNLGTR